MRIQKPTRAITALLACFFLQACNQGGGGGSAADSSSPTIPETKSCEQEVSYKNYFEDAVSQDGVNSTPTENLVRERIVTVNTQELKADILAGSSTLYLDLFDDHQVIVEVEKIEKTSDSQIVVSGHIRGDALSSVAIALNNGVVIATIKPFDKKEYQIVYRGDGTHSIQETTIDDETPETCLAETTVNSVNFNEEHGEESAQGEEVEQAVTGTPTIDVLVAYTPNARAAAGGESAMKAQIQTAIANGNKGFRDSKVNLAVRLVGTVALTQNETSDYSADLTALRTKGDGKWDIVHSERTRLGADQVTVIGSYTNGGGTAGIGYVDATVTTAFTIVKRSALSSMYTFSHELGHNLGLQHSDGYVSTAGKFRTLMAYGTYPRIIRYSSPSLSYNNYVTGTASQNSAAILNSKGARVSTLVASKVATGAKDVPVVTLPSCAN